MKALVLEAYNKLVYKEVPTPEIADHEVLVRVKACGICGSDVHGMDGSSGRRIPPIIMGHEASGTIAKMGKNVRNWKISDRVTFDSTIYPQDDWFTKRGQYNLSDHRRVLGVSPGDYRQNGAFAEYVVVPDHILYRIPDNVTFEQAAMVEPVAVAAHAIGLTKIALNDTVVVVGAGMIGLFLIQLLSQTSAGKIIAVDLDPRKLELAKNFGADETLDSNAMVMENIKTHTEDRGADVVFEAVGLSTTLTLAVESVRKGGSVTLIGNLVPKAELPLQSVVTRQITIQGSCAICGEYDLVLKMMSEGKIDVSKMISAVVPLADGADWFKKLYDKTPGLNKIILEP